MTTIAKSVTLLIVDMVGGPRESFSVGIVLDALLPEWRSGEITASKAETQ